MNILVAIFLLGLVGLVHAAVFVLARRAVTRACSVERQTSGALAGARWVAGLGAWYAAGALLFAVGKVAAGESDLSGMRIHVSASGAAARAGVQDGDRIVRYGGEAVTSWKELGNLVTKHGNEATTLEVARGGETVVVSVTPVGSPPKLGVHSWAEQRSVSVGRALAIGAVQPALVVGGSVRAFWSMFVGRDAVEVTGATGVVTEASKATRDGFSEGFLFSTNIASYLLPLMALSTAIYEFFNRRHLLSLKARAAVSQTGS